MPFPYLTVLCEMTVTIPKPLMSLKGMIVKDTELLKVSKEAEGTVPIERFPPN